MTATKKYARWLLAALLAAPALAFAAEPELPPYFSAHCFECHDSETKKGNLDLSALKADFANPDLFGRWVKVHDRIESGEMPPKKHERPPADETTAVRDWLHSKLLSADQARIAAESRTGIRRLTRAEYENTIRDLFVIRVYKPGRV